MKARITCAVAAWLCVISTSTGSSQQAQITYEVRQLTSGPAHHFYGYIGHVGNSPYSADGRHLIALRTTFQDRMPGPQDAADIALLDATQKNPETKLDETPAAKAIASSFSCARISTALAGSTFR